MERETPNGIRVALIAVIQGCLRKQQHHRRHKGQMTAALPLQEGFCRWHQLSIGAAYHHRRSRNQCEADKGTGNKVAGAGARQLHAASSDSYLP